MDNQVKDHSDKEGYMFVGSHGSVLS